MLRCHIFECIDGLFDSTTFISPAIAIPLHESYYLVSRSTNPHLFSPSLLLFTISICFSRTFAISLHNATIHSHPSLSTRNISGTSNRVNTSLHSVSAGYNCMNCRGGIWGWRAWRARFTEIVDGGGIVRGCYWGSAGRERVRVWW